MVTTTNATTVRVSKPRFQPKKPYPDFPLTPHRNGQWVKKVNGRLYYFGRWTDDLKGERALKDWEARQDAIRAGLDKLRVATVGDGMVLGELMARFLADRRTKMTAGELAASTYGDYLKYLPAFAGSVGKDAIVAELAPAHFQAYAAKLIDRNLGRHTRRRIIANIKAMLNWGASNGFHPMPVYGTGFVAPTTSPDAMRQAKARAGEKDYSQRIVTGSEIIQLMDEATPLFRGLILLAVNCGLGPADLGRLRWSNINMETGELDMPRGKTGTDRKGYVWKQTSIALQRVATLKHNARAIKKHGADAIVFISRAGLPMYRETEIVKDGRSVGVKCENAITPTFGRLAKRLGLKGVSFYRLRHTFKTLGKRAKDRDALNLCMGHKEPGIGHVYDHEEISFDRIKRVALAVKYALWPKPENKKKQGSLKAGQMRLAS